MKTLLFPGDAPIQEKTCVALGNFDGIHKGHQKVLKTCASVAKKDGTAAAVYTFHMHPRAFLGQHHAVITTNAAKEDLLSCRKDICYLVYQKTDADILKLTPEQFVHNILKRQLNASSVVVGSHYSFGCKSIGTAELLSELCEKNGITTYVVPLELQGDMLCSSTAIRTFIANGEIENANDMLGYSFFIKGTVVHGNHIGSTIGFPTINIYPAAEQLLPKFGVYATQTEIDGIDYDSVTNVGIKPTVGSSMPIVETNLIDVSADFYGKTAKIKFKKYLRTEKQFSDLQELKKQIAEDTNNARQYLKLGL